MHKKISYSTILILFLMTMTVWSATAGNTVVVSASKDSIPVVDTSIKTDTITTIDTTSVLERVSTYDTTIVEGAITSIDTTTIDTVKTKIDTVQKVSVIHLLDTTGQICSLTFHMVIPEEKVPAFCQIRNVTTKSTKRLRLRNNTLQWRSELSNEGVYTIVVGDSIPQKSMHFSYRVGANDSVSITVMKEWGALSKWTTLPRNIDQTFITVGGKQLFSFGSRDTGFQVRYYGLMYIAAIFTCLYMIKYLRKRETLPFSKDQTEGLVTWSILGVILGGRLGFVLFYQPEMLTTPLDIILPFKNGQFVGISGMSYHGGLIGVGIASWLYIRKEKLPWFKVMNYVAIIFPLGYTWGRIGNFLNGELWGRETTANVAMLFPMDTAVLMRHPSQLYEATLEGLLLFVILQVLYHKVGYLKNKMIPLYLWGYGLARFTVEFFREPDSSLGPFGLTRGQILSSLMFIAGAIFFYYIAKKEKAEKAA